MADILFFEINLLVVELVVDGGDCCCCPLIKARSFNKPDTCGTLLGAKEIEPAIWLYSVVINWDCAHVSISTATQVVQEMEDSLLLPETD